MDVLSNRMRMIAAYSVVRSALSKGRLLGAVVVCLLCGLCNGSAGSDRPPAIRVSPRGYFEAIDSPSIARDLGSADFDQDGEFDICVPDFDEMCVLVAYGSKEGWNRRFAKVECMKLPTTVDTGDINRDGYPDFVVGSSWGGMQVFLGRAGGTEFERVYTSNYAGAVTAVSDHPEGTLIAVGTMRQVTVMATADGHEFTEYPPVSLPGGVMDFEFTPSGDPVRRLAVVVNEPSMLVVYLEQAGGFTEEARWPIAADPFDVSVAHAAGRTMIGVACRSDTVVLVTIASDSMSIERRRVEDVPVSVMFGEFRASGEVSMGVVCWDPFEEHRSGVKFLSMMGGDSEVKHRVGRIGYFTRSIAIETVRGPVIATVSPAEFGAHAPVVTLFRVRDLGSDGGVSTLVGAQALEKLEVVDINGDGHADVVGSSSAEGILAYLGDGRGTLSPRVLSAMPNVGDARPFSVADGTGDGVPDVFVGDAGSHGVVLMENIGGGQFRSVRTYPTGDRPIHVKVVTGDEVGTQLFSVGAQNIHVFRLGEHGADVSVTRVPGLRHITSKVSDMDRDGHLDIIQTPRTETPAVVLWGTEGGDFLVDSVDVGRSDEWGFGDTGDVDGNGLDDLLICRSAQARNACEVHTFMQVAPRVFVNTAIFEIRSDMGVRLCDVDSDGNLEMVALDAETDVIVVDDVRGEEAPVLIGTGHNPVSMAIGDLNDDDLPEIVTAATFGGQLCVHLSEGPTPVRGCELSAEVEPVARTVLLTWTRVPEGAVARVLRYADGAPELLGVFSPEQVQYRDVGPRGADDVFYSLEVVDRYGRVVCQEMSAVTGRGSSPREWVKAFRVECCGSGGKVVIAIETAHAVPCTLFVVDLQGRLVRRLFQGEVNGEWVREWQIGELTGGAASVAFVVLESGPERIARKAFSR